jgi:hypothetical protein
LYVKNFYNTMLYIVIDKKPPHIFLKYLPLSERNLFFVDASYSLLKTNNRGLTCVFRKIIMVETVVVDNTLVLDMYDVCARV